MNVLVAVNGLDAIQRQRLREGLPGQAVVFADTCGTEADRKAALADADVVFGNLPAAQYAPRLRVKWVQLESAGVDAYLGINQDRPTPIQLTHLRGFYDEAVAECVLAGILAYHRQLPQLLAAQREQRWVKPLVEPQIRQLHGSRVVILGAGGIARRLEAILAALNCSTRFFARSAPVATLRSLADLDAALPTADLLINTLPHTPATTAILDAERLARLPAAALLVNVGRGSAVDEAALVDALDHDRLSGAILDVTQREPLPPESPLWRHPRVLLTQHTGGRFPGETARKVDVFLDNFSRFARGEPLASVVETARGY